MDISEIASVAGKGGLFKILKPTRTGVILESLDQEKKKLVAQASNRVSVLSEISIFTTDAEGSVPLIDVMQTIYKEFGDDTGIEQSATKEELFSFMKHVLPDFDEDQVYPSDIKKLLSWYQIIVREVPEVLTAKADGEETEKKEDK